MSDQNHEKLKDKEDFLERYDNKKHAAQQADYAVANFLDILSRQEIVDVETGLNRPKTEREILIEQFQLPGSPAKEVGDITYSAFVEPHIQKILATYRENGESDGFLKGIEPFIRNEWKRPDYQRTRELTR